MKAILKKFMLPAVMLTMLACNNSSNSEDGKDGKEGKISSDAKPNSKDTLVTDSKKKGEGAEVWAIDEGASKIGFTIKNFGKDVTGSIGGLKGSIHFNDKKPEAGSFDASVKVATINTNNTKRDADLMGDKYFKDEQHPEIIFRSKEISRSAKGYTAKGDLSINGISKPIDMPFDFEEKDNKGIFSSKFTINRHDYDIGGNGPIMGDDINVQLKVIANKN